MVLGFISLCIAHLVYSFQLRMLARDNGSPQRTSPVASLEVFVLRNDFTPYFVPTPTYLIQDVPQNTQPNSVIGAVTARDNDTVVCVLFHNI